MASQGHCNIKYNMINNKASFGIKNDLKSKDLLKNSQALMESSTKLISLLQLQLQRCKSLVDKLTF